MATKKLRAFRIILTRGKLAPITVAVRAAENAEEALSAYLKDNRKSLIPGNAGKLACGHKSISIRYGAVQS